MNQKFILAFLVFFLSSFVFSQEETKEQKSEMEISICSPKLKESGRQSSFRFGYRYIIQTDKEGLAKDVRYLKSKYNYESLADSLSVVSCLEKWKLSPSKKYRIYISFGTYGGLNSLYILSKDARIRILI